MSDISAVLMDMQERLSPYKNSVYFSGIPGLFTLLSEKETEVVHKYKGFI